MTIQNEMRVAAGLAPLPETAESLSLGDACRLLDLPDAEAHRQMQAAAGLAPTRQATRAEAYQRGVDLLLAQQGAPVAPVQPLPSTGQVAQRRQAEADARDAARANVRDIIMRALERGGLSAEEQALADGLHRAAAEATLPADLRAQLDSLQGVLIAGIRRAVADGASTEPAKWRPIVESVFSEWGKTSPEAGMYIDAGTVAPRVKEILDLGLATEPELPEQRDTFHDMRAAAGVPASVADAAGQVVEGLGRGHLRTA